MVNITKEKLKIDNELKKKIEFNIPVIAVTADAVNNAGEKYISEGFANYISKPYTKTQINEKMLTIFTK